MPADWTDAPVNYGDDKPVIRHAPDPSRYYFPGEDQIYRTGGSPAGRYATIPEGKGVTDGGSKGFDLSKAGPMLVHLDPKDRGIVFDPAGLTKEQIATAVNDSTYAYEAFQKLARAAPVQSLIPAIEAGPVNPHVSPGTYLTPATNPDGTAYHPYQPSMEAPPVTPLPPVPPLPNMTPQFFGPTVVGPVQPGVQPNGQPPGMPPQPVQQPYYPPPAQQPYYPPPPPVYQPPPDPTGDLLRQLTAAVMDLSRRQAESEKRAAASPPSPAPLATMPMDVAEPVYRETPVQRHQLAEERPIRAGKALPTGPAQEAPRPGMFDLAWLRETPVKPGLQAIFEIPRVGHQAARYHDIIDSQHVVVLVYDTRYEEGSMYLPIEMDSSIRFQAPSLNIDLTVRSMGLNFNFGSFDMIVLVKVPNQAVDSGFVDAQDAMTAEQTR